MGPVRKVEEEAVVEAGGGFESCEFAQQRERRTSLGEYAHFVLIPAASGFSFFPLLGGVGQLYCLPVHFGRHHPRGSDRNAEVARRGQSREGSEGARDWVRAALSIPFYSRS